MIKMAMAVNSMTTRLMRVFVLSLLIDSTQGEQKCQEGCLRCASPLDCFECKVGYKLQDLLCWVKSGLAVSDPAGVRKCTVDFTNKMAMSGMAFDVMTQDVEKVKSKFCPTYKDYYKCYMRHSSEKRLTEEEMEELMNKLKPVDAKMQQAIQACKLDHNQLADEVWSAAGVVRPWSLLEIVAVALAAIFCHLKALIFMLDSV